MNPSLAKIFVDRKRSSFRMWMNTILPLSRVGGLSRMATEKVTRGEATHREKRIGTPGQCGSRRTRGASRVLDRNRTLAEVSK
jgi:hypothetical protein